MRRSFLVRIIFLSALITLAACGTVSTPTLPTLAPTSVPPTVVPSGTLTATSTPQPTSTEAMTETAAPLTLDEWIKTNQPSQELLKQVMVPYLNALGVADGDITLEAELLAGVNGQPFAVQVDKKTSVPLLISGTDAQGVWIWKEATPGNIGKARWNMFVGTNYGHVGEAGVREAAQKFNTVFVSYDMTWKFMEKTQGQVTFESPSDWAFADREVQYGLDHNQTIMGGHLLDWNSYPDWLKNGIKDGSLSKDQVKDIVRSRIKTMMEHYGDKVTMWTVVNEFAPLSVGWREDPLQNSLGDYVEFAFQTAREVNPKATLILNGDGNETPDLAMYQYDLKLAKSLHDKGLIDGMGIQMHLIRYKNNIPTYQEILNTLNAYKAVGVPVYMTEFDVNMQNMAGSDNELQAVGLKPATMPADAQRRRQLIHAKIVKNVVKAAIDSHNVKLIIFFNLGDNFNWLKDDFG
ncbi:MAG TPA: endo-1,4-beta-xylanase, partial [Saprospiraceae bacterium]|nr:endo-1,4-beta-xylanase [Saprospiraceae bacterium]